MSLYAIRPLMDLNVVARKPSLAILMYHGISDNLEPDVSPYYQTNTSPALFAQQVRWLTDEGFRSVGLEEGLQLAEQGRLGQEKVVVMTFDDGFRDFYDSAFPVLQAHGYTATVFLPTAFIGQSRQSFKGRGCLTWQEVRELRAQGIQFGSHTVIHPVLYKTPWSHIREQLSSSRRTLEQELGETITSFAYPYAFPQQDRQFTDAFKKLLREEGYRQCLTTMIGRVRAGDDSFSLKRLPVNNCDDQSLLLAKVNGAYDWFAHPQRWFKSARHYLGRAGRREADLLPAAQSL
jgi:peptidoglycan/xylan/chitin deacetylase (PgdA/CDA1 family)